MNDTSRTSQIGELIATGQTLEDAGDALGALSMYEAAAKIAPFDARVQLNRGNALAILGRVAEAEAAFRLIAGRGSAEAHLNLGNLYLRSGEFDAALQAYRAAARLRPGWAAAGFGELCVLHATGHQELLAEVERYLEQHPNHPDARRMRMEILSTSEPISVLSAIDPLTCDDTAILRLRASAASIVFDHESCVSDLNRAIEADPFDTETLCALAFASMVQPPLNGPAALHPIIARAMAKTVKHRPSLRASPPYRIGYLSGDYRAHPAANFLMPFFLGHRRDLFIPVAVSSGEHRDAITDRLMASAPNWIDISACNDQAAAELLLDARLDVLVDFSGWTAGNRLPLLASRVAPVQITAIGVYMTTGVPEIDFRICDEYCDPPGLTETQHSERLLRTAGPHACYFELRPIPTSEIQPARVNGHFTFGYFNNSAKITVEMIDQWIEILRRVPNARLRVVGVRHEASRRWLADRLASGDVIDRVDIFGRLDAVQYDRALTSVDIALDSFPYNGGTTTIECLLAGVPVLTRSGPWSFSRSARVFLDPLGLSSWAVSSATEFIERATAIALGPLENLENLRINMPRCVRSSSLASIASYIVRWEDALLEAIKHRRDALL